MVEDNETKRENGVVELKQSPTTIWIKKGTKTLLDSLGERKDTYDDIIRALVKKVEALKKEKELNQQCVSENTLKISNKNTRKSNFRFENGFIEYTYNVPQLPLSEDFSFNVYYARIVFKSNEQILNTKEYKDSLGRAKDYLRIIEQIIKQHIDPLFNIDEKHMFDFSWWERMFKNLGLPHESYKEDIEFGLIKLGFAP